MYKRIKQKVKWRIDERLLCRYTAEEREVLASHESLDYLPPDSRVYRRWVAEQSGRYGVQLQRCQWFFIIIIKLLLRIVGPIGIAGL